MNGSDKRFLWPSLLHWSSSCSTAFIVSFLVMDGSDFCWDCPLLKDYEIMNVSQSVYLTLVPGSVDSVTAFWLPGY